MDTNIMLYIGIAFIVSIVITYFITNTVANKKTKNHKSLGEAIESQKKELEANKAELKNLKANIEQLNSDTQELQELKI